MFQMQAPYTFDEFYDDLQNNDYSDGFGKMTDLHQGPRYKKGFKKITSVQNFNMNQAYNGNIKKSSSSNAFPENENDFFYMAKHVSNQRFNDQSTRASRSHFTSVASLSSMSSTQTFGSQKGFVKPQGKRKVATETDFRNKYKTEVCRYWAEHGFCEFGDQCAFAHGGNEVRQKSFVAQNFKTKHCAAYHETGYCVYGIRCQFLHCYRKDCHANPRLMFLSYADDLENIEVWLTENPDCLCLRRQSRPRLPILEKLANGKPAQIDEFSELFSDDFKQIWND